MALHPLNNATWGFASNCFVCEPRNDRGLHIDFAHDDETEAVVAEFALDDSFSGAPTYVHGGIVLAVLDEAMAWATIAIAHTFALTASTSTDFLRPVKVGRTYRVEARMTGESDGQLLTGAEVLDERGRPCARATARFTPLQADRAAAALGVEASGDDAGYLRG